MLLVAAGLGLVAIFAVDSKLEELRREAATDPTRAVELLTSFAPMLALVLTLPLLCIVLFGFWIAYRTRISERFPPPGVSVLRPTEILKGERAVRRARLLSLLTTAILAMALAVPVLLMRLIASLSEVR